MSPDGYRFPVTFREALLKTLPEETSLHGNIPDVRNTYIPETHIKALRLDTMLVAGIRGAGKSFWWSALQNPGHRDVLGPKASLSKETIVSTGFGEIPLPKNYPNNDTLAFLQEKYDARIVWRTVVFSHVGEKTAPLDFHSLTKWEDRVEWVKRHPEETEYCLAEADETLFKSDTHHLVIFDALDRAAEEWKSMNTLVRGLLQNLIAFRSYKRIRLKLFLRTDQLDDPSVTAFPDSSKVLSEKADLFWPRNELYGLLWQYMANSEKGDLFRDGCKELTLCRWTTTGSVWTVPETLRRDEREQRKIFHALTGPWMGKDPRRGFPYTWLINHLGDTRQQVSPRSFLAALRHAASEPLRPDQPYALHYESIKRGVQEASKIRVREMQEDYPWVEPLLKPLGKKINVPCGMDEVESLWNQEKVLEQLKQIVQSSDVRLPPSHLDEGSRGLMKDLAQLGVIGLISRDRINIPDVYRIGYGIGRRGGITPVARV